MDFESDAEAKLVLSPGSSSGTYVGPILSPDGMQIAFYLYNQGT